LRRSFGSTADFSANCIQFALAVVSQVEVGLALVHGLSGANAAVQKVLSGHGDAAFGRWLPISAGSDSL
jgi:hypothetical protein